MAYTVQQVVDQARIPLNDEDKDRYTDDVLLTYFNDAVLMCRRKRPDLFLSQWSDLPEKLVLADAFPINTMYVPYFADYIAGRAETIDDEHIQNSRAGAFIQSFMMGLTTI